MVTKETIPEWKAERIRSLERSLDFWSVEKKLEREIYVVSALLLSLKVPFAKEELTEGAEPLDVAFRDCNFQVKEIMQSDRKRTDQYREALLRAKNAQTYSELLEEYYPKPLPLDRMVLATIDRSRKLEQKYGPRERESLDLVCYVNFDDCEEIPSKFTLPDECGFRSLSLVSNRYCLVLFCAPTAPSILKASTGRLLKVIHPEYQDA